MVNKFIDIYFDNFFPYHYDEWYWIINPVTREWIICVSNGGYIFFNRDSWSIVFNFYPSNDTINDIQNWVVCKLGVPKNKHCYPDYIPMDYDWRDEFKGQKIIDVMNKGVKCFSIV